MSEDREPTELASHEPRRSVLQSLRGHHWREVAVPFIRMWQTAWLTLNHPIDLIRFHVYDAALPESLRVPFSRYYSKVAAEARPPLNPLKYFGMVTAAFIPALSVIAYLSRNSNFPVQSISYSFVGLPLVDDLILGTAVLAMFLIVPLFMSVFFWFMAHKEVSFEITVDLMAYFQATALFFHLFAMIFMFPATAFSIAWVHDMSGGGTAQHVLMGIAILLLLVFVYWVMWKIFLAYIRLYFIYPYRVLKNVFNVPKNRVLGAFALMFLVAIGLNLSVLFWLKFPTV